MKGTEKQIRWAEDIKANAINTCTANIERMSSDPFFALDVEIYKIIRDTLVATFAKVDDASAIINKRAKFDPATINNMASRAHELIASGRMTLEQYAKC